MSGKITDRAGSLGKDRKSGAQSPVPGVMIWLDWVSSKELGRASQDVGEEEWRWEAVLKGWENVICRIP